ALNCSALSLRAIEYLRGIRKHDDLNGILPGKSPDQLKSLSLCFLEPISKTHAKRIVEKNDQGARLWSLDGRRDLPSKKRPRESQGQQQQSRYSEREQQQMTQFLLTPGFLWHPRYKH